MTKYSPFNNKLIIFNSLSVIAIYQLQSFSEGDYMVKTGIWLMMMVTVVCQWHFIINVKNEMATELGIRVLKVKPKNPYQIDEQSTSDGVASQGSDYRQLEGTYEENQQNINCKMKFN